MSDNSATAVYNGQGLTVSGWQARGERNADTDDNDKTADQDGDSICLEGESGESEAFGCHSGDRVPNLNVIKVSRPAKTRSLPANLATNPLSSGRGR